VRNPLLIFNLFLFCLSYFTCIHLNIRLQFLRLDIELANRSLIIKTVTKNSKITVPLETLNWTEFCTVYKNTASLLFGSSCEIFSDLKRLIRSWSKILRMSSWTLESWWTFHICVTIQLGCDSILLKTWPWMLKRKQLKQSDSVRRPLEAAILSWQDTLLFSSVNLTYRAIWGLKVNHIYSFAYSILLNTNCSVLFVEAVGVTVPLVRNNMYSKLTILNTDGSSFSLIKTEQHKCHVECEST